MKGLQVYKRVRYLRNQVSSGNILQGVDQVLAATISYFTLIPFLLRRDFANIARVSIALTLYTFFLGAIRIFIVNNILDQRLSHIKTREHLSKALVVSSLSFACIPLYQFLNLSLIESTAVSLLIVISMQQEVLRQDLLSKRRFANAIAIDSVWLFTSSLLIFCLTISGILDVKNALFSLAFGALVSVLFANRYREIVSLEAKSKEIIAPLGKSVLIIPIVTTIHTLVFNHFMFMNNEVSELGLFRSIQFIFLPAIFLINIQQNYFVPAISSQDKSEIVSLQSRFFFLQRKVLFGSSVLALLYIEFTGVPYSFSFLILVVAVSITLNTRIGNLSLYFIVLRKQNILILSRLVWIIVCSTLMCFLRRNIFLLLISLCFVDYLYLLLLKLDFRRASLHNFRSME